MSALVLDCSVTMSWCFDDEADQYSDKVLDALVGGEAAVPAIWPLEVGNVLLVAERRRRLTEAAALKFVELLKALPIRVDEKSSARALGQVLSLGRQHGLSTYDAAYLELAIRLGAPLATKDRALKAACHKSGVPSFTAR